MQRWTHSDLERRWQLHCFRLIRNALKNSSGPRDTEQVWLGRTIETQALNLKQSKLNKCDARLIILKLAILCSEPVICSWSEFGIVTCRIDQIANFASAQQFFQNLQRFSLLKVATAQREWLPHQIVKLYVLVHLFTTIKENSRLTKGFIKLLFWKGYDKVVIVYWYEKVVTVYWYVYF